MAAVAYKLVRHKTTKKLYVVTNATTTAPATYDTIGTTFNHDALENDVLYHHVLDTLQMTSADKKFPNMSFVSFETELPS